MDLGFRMHAERTPNPNSVKWVLSNDVVEGVAGANFDQRPDPESSPLAAALFEVKGVAGVFLGHNFVTVTKAEECEWTDLAAPVVERIKAWAESDVSALGPAFELPAEAARDEVVTRIIEILEKEIRPYVAMDGGEITFAGFRDGVVEVYLQGACAGCPSSSITLKMGIENRLREELPQVEKVVAL